jgi:hypothetical protein
LHESKWLHSEIPENTTVIEHIKKQTDWQGAIEAVGGFDFQPDLSVPNLKVNAEKIREELRHLYRQVGAVVWASQNSINLYGLSLTCNPEMDESLHMGSFGHSRYKVFSSYQYYKAVNADTANHVKNDYLDSLGFRKILPQVEECENLYALLTGFKVPTVRCTARTINGSLCYPTMAGDGGMHKDDCPFEVLRINISITNNGDFGLQYEGMNPIYNAAGENIVVNTDVSHRAFIKQNNDFLRTNLVIGVTPWLDYDPTKDEWSLNKYFGKVHPYDIVKQGLLI